MKSTLLFLMVTVVFVAIVNSSPVENDSEGEPVRADRHKRLTCDLLSFQLPKFAVNHSACAAHCLALLRGYKGGSCKGGVCHCRR